MTNGDGGALDPTRAVLDTSALFSAHRHWLWSTAARGHFQGFWSTYIVSELVRIRVERSIAHGVERTIYRDRTNRLVHALSAVLRVADYRQVATSGMLRDPDDEPVLATALAASASYLVSLNTRDFPPDRQVEGVHFVTPLEFQAILMARWPDAGLRELFDDPTRLLP